MPSLSEADRRLLLELARQSIIEAVSQQKLPRIAHEGPVFGQKSGLFVTLHARGRLRGCIGVVEAYEPLPEAVAHCAVSAALQDPRFSPVRPDELDEIRIEISLLSTPEPIQPENVEIGKHGLLVSQGTQRGLLLPQVAVEHKLGREQFLQETCRKAGLPPDAWREKETQVLGFTGEVFAEPA
jgi:AmmeMemoRadiSam system protein A